MKMFFIKLFKGILSYRNIKIEVLLTTKYVFKSAGFIFKCTHTHIKINQKSNTEYKST